MTRVGLVARAEDRGLGILSWEFARALSPERVLVIDMGVLARGFKPHLERYPDATVVAFDGKVGTLPEAQVRDWLQGLDVVYAAETFYDWRMLRWAEEAGVATVLHSMPEFHRPDMPEPTEVWVPTTWRLDDMPAGARVMPVPVADDRFPFCPPDRDGPLRVLHVAGHRAMADRNGTGVLLTALRWLRGPMEVTMLTQDARLPAGRGRGGVKVKPRLRGVRNYWDLYADADVLVMPRRYGGLCLPVQEAMAAGLAVVMTGCEPQASTWPIVPIPSRPGHQVRMPCGPVTVEVPQPEALARTLQLLAQDPDRLRDAQCASVAWAEAHRWSELRPAYEQALARAAG